VCAFHEMASDEGIIARAKAGEHEAFTVLVATYGGDVLRLCAVIIGDPTAAEDAAQNTWHKVWSRLDTLRQASQIRSWILTIAANEARQVLRRGRRFAAVTLEDASDIPRAFDAQGDAELRAALLMLDPADRELLAHRYVIGSTSEEIGRRFGLSAGGARSRLKRIRERLEKEMRADG
jgi:RNA polymerase sigma-70 factor (ECF subfamily)